MSHFSLLKLCLSSLEAVSFVGSDVHHPRSKTIEAGRVCDIRMTAAGRHHDHAPSNGLKTASGRLLYSIVNFPERCWVGIEVLSGTPHLQVCLSTRKIVIVHGLPTAGSEIGPIPRLKISSDPQKSRGQQ